MIYLIIVSIIWALSFSLIKGNLSSLDSNFVAFIRLLISFLIFLPFLRIKNISSKINFHLIFIGIIQYGIMYLTYIYSFQFLKAYEVAILTLLTPFFIVLIMDIWEKKINYFHWITALLTIAGSFIIVYKENFSFGFWKGILLVQISNFCFALGQVYYKKIIEKNFNIKPHQTFALLYFGAILITGIFSIASTDFKNLQINSSQILALLYLGIVASGIGFFLWNIGVTKVETGILAIMNNLKIPLGVLFAFTLIGEETNFIQLSFGSILIIFAFILNYRFANR
ncbi:MAG: EamA family transporter [Ignavibacteriae bacterium]|nr:EamA family transporter [Ignavibacteriota bacterium]